MANAYSESQQGSGNNGGGENHNYVYVRSEDEAWLPARLLQVKGHEATVQVAVNTHEPRASSSVALERWTVSLKDYPHNALPLQNCDVSGTLQPVPDMIDLPHLHEAAILFNLKERHANEQPYTRTGDIVIAVNPYHWMHHYYTKERRAEYTRALIHNNRPVQELAPHVYEASALAYKGLLHLKRNQSILVSGESGAGKTETTKICLGHIASVSDNEDSIAVQRVLDSNPLLEAFGNAKTTRNDNSSRFGKYLQLQFDSSPTLGSQLVGSQCQVYLLEKSRVVHHSLEERTFHIFYQLLAAPEFTKADIWEGLAGKTNESFKYVGRADTDTIEGVTDADRFQQTVKGLELLGVQGSEMHQLWRAVCAVLQLGNLTFRPHPEDSELAVVDNADVELGCLANLLGLSMASSTADLKKALLERKIEARGEIMAATVSADKAKHACDALAKEIYHRAFFWLVRRINQATSCCAKQQRATPISTIGLLDIFGFESFETNGFEQLCINYANEKLQQKFTRDIFATVMAEYKFEGIRLEEIMYDDNTNVLDLIEGKTNGVLAMLNEECIRPKGSDAVFVNKIIAQNKNSLCLIVEHMFDQYEFGIRHFAGNVIYSAREFVAKNNDTVPTDLQEVAMKSSNEIIAASPEGWSKDETRTQSRYTSRPTGRGYSRKNSNIVGETVWGKFRMQLNDLMSELEHTQTRYIRCIKPNSTKSPRVMEHVTTVDQLRCAGVVAAVTISRSAFPNRLEHKQVLERFCSLWPKGVAMCSEGSIDVQNRTNVDVLLTSSLQKMQMEKNKRIVKAFVTGRTRTYFRAGALEFLDVQRLDGMAFWATEIQRIYRGIRQQRDYNQKRVATVHIQAQLRCSFERRRFNKLRQSAVALQCWQRINIAKLAVAFRKVQRGAAAAIQHIVRGKLQRKRYLKALQDNKDETNLRLQMQKMQLRMEEVERQRQEELERELELARQEREADQLALRKLLEEEMARLHALEEKDLQLAEMRRQLEEAERRRREEVEKERRKRIESEQRAREAAERNRLKDDARKLEEERRRIESREGMLKRLEEIEHQHQEELERERDQTRLKVEADKLALQLAEQKRLEDEKSRLVASEQKLMQAKEVMKKLLEQAEIRHEVELERERQVASQLIEAQRLATEEAEYNRLREEKARLTETEKQRIQETEEMKKQIEEIERKGKEAIEQEKELARQRIEADQLVLQEMEQKRVLEVSQMRQEIAALRKQRDEAEKQLQEEKLQRQREIRDKKLEDEERAILEAERKAMEDEMSRFREAEKKKLETEIDRLRSEKLELAEKYQEASLKAANLAARPPPEPEVKIVEIIKVVEKELKPKRDIMTDEQKALMEESGKIIEFLRCENMKLKKKSDQLRRDFETIKDSNKQLMEANASASQSFQQLNQHAKQLNATNQNLSNAVAQYRHKISELHGEIKNRQAYYSEVAAAYTAESDARIFYEHAMLEIVDSVSANSCDPIIHSVVMAKVMECAKVSNKVAGYSPDVEEAESSLLEL